MGEGGGGGVKAWPHLPTEVNQTVVDSVSTTA